MKINVNAVYKNIEKEILSYEDVVVLAGKNPNMVLSVSYSHRQSEKQGMLCKGDSVTAIDGMVFNVFDTSNS